MLNLNLIRTQVLLAGTPGPLAEAAIRAIVTEAERYKAEGGEVVGAREVREARKILEGLRRKA